MLHKVKTIILSLAFLSLNLYGQKSVNTFDKNGKTALINAITSNNLKKVKQLINDDANVNLKEEKGLQGTPLMYATHTGNIELCLLLITNGADINAVDINKDHALNWATYYGQTSIIKLLIKNGANIHLKSKHGTAVDVALRLWHQDSIINTFRVFYKNKNTKKENQIIKYAIEGNFDKLISKWDNKISPDLKDNIGIPLLQFTAQANHKKATQFLISKGANTNILNSVGQTPLTWAARFGHIEIIKLLLNAGANVNKTDTKYQLTPLIGAAVNGTPKVGKLLLDNGANIAHKEVVNDVTALHWGIFKNNIDFVKMLVNQGANYHEKVMDNQMSAYEMAVSYQNKELLIFFDFKDTEKRKKALIGSWKIKKIHYLYPDTTYIKKELDYGRLLISKNHYAIQYQPMMMKRTPFKKLSKGEDKEIIKAFQTIVFNSGSYTLENDVIRTKADIAKVPGFEGGQQHYKIKLDTNNLTMIMFDETYPNGEKPEWHGKIKIKFFLIKEQ